MFYGGGSARKAMELAASCPQDHVVCPKCEGSGVFKRYKPLEWYGESKPDPVVESLECEECHGYRFVKFRRTPP